MATPEVPRELRDVLDMLPTAAGGSVIVAATGGEPPAIAMLSTGDVWLGEGTVRFAVHASSSIGTRLGTGCTLLVPAGDVAYRLELGSVRQRPAGALLLVEGDLIDIRPTGEPPWKMLMTFHPDGSADPEPFVTFWRHVRAWLGAGADGDAPAPPTVDG